MPSRTTLFRQRRTTEVGAQNEPGRGRKTHAENVRLDWIRTANATNRDGGHNISDEIGPSVACRGTPREPEYLVLRCTRCAALGVYRAKKYFAESICRTPYVHDRILAAYRSGEVPAGTFNESELETIATAASGHGPQSLGAWGYIGGSTLVIQYVVGITWLRR